MVLQPLPGAALVVIGLAALTANGVPMREALGGYAEPSVWLVLAAMLMARAIFASGLARRLALHLHPPLRPAARSASPTPW